MDYSKYYGSVFWLGAVVLDPAGAQDREARTNGVFYLVDTQGGPAFQLCQSFTGVNNILYL